MSSFYDSVRLANLRREADENKRRSQDPNLVKGANEMYEREYNNTMIKIQEELLRQLKNNDR